MFGKNQPWSGTWRSSRDLDHYRITFQLKQIDDLDITAQKTTLKTARKTTPMQMAIIGYLKLHPQASRKQLAENIPGISESGIKYNLKRLKEMGMITHVGSAKGGHWEIIE
ncbi:MAG: winged helix-turn-helix transcriptional regulator [Candidatus Thermoplasmatota archaeon]|nr:winged helix-turn-helix transcriptional regulator [Candidatus Thermoplasmatota archaeon]